MKIRGWLSSAEALGLVTEDFSSSTALVLFDLEDVDLPGLRLRVRSVEARFLGVVARRVQPANSVRAFGEKTMWLVFLANGHK